MAERLWDQSDHEGRPDPGAARGMVDTLAQAVAQNRTALVALTALKDYDNYTFTHMVNVSILTMGQARAVGIDGPLLREFGLAGLMHDIGKVRTPDGDPEQTRQAHRRRVRDHEAPRRRRRGDPAAHARDPDDCAGRRLRAPSAPRWHGLSRGRETRDAEPGDGAVLDRGCLRRHAIAAGVPEVVPDRSHQGRARRQCRPAIRSAPRASLRAADRHLPAGQPRAPQHRRDCRRAAGLRARSAPAPRARGVRARWPAAWSASTTSTSGRARQRANGQSRSRRRSIRRTTTSIR